MTKFVVAKETVAHLMDLLTVTGCLQIDFQIEESSAEGALPLLTIDISGEDAGLFVRNNFELLKAVHKIAAAALDLEGEEHDLLWFDVHHLRRERMGQLQELARRAVTYVRSTHRPHAFAPMLPCERHMLHQALRSSGLRSASQGEGAERCVILYPEAPETGQTIEPPPVSPPGQHDAAA
jgi:spoIIIJ-associated protein